MPPTGMEYGPLWLAAIGLLLLILFAGVGVHERRIARSEREEKHQHELADWRRDWGL